MQKPPLDPDVADTAPESDVPLFFLGGKGG